MQDLNKQVTVAKMPAVAVVILNWNGKYFLKKFLPPLLASTYNNMQVIVADNASTDGSVLWLKEKFPTIEIIINPVNEGFAKGYNTALKQVDADYFILLNSDVEVTPGWIEPIVNIMEADKKIAACQPKILDEKNKQYFEYAGACGGFIDVLGYPFARGRVLEKIEKDNKQYDDAVPCFWASGAALFVRANVYKTLGGLDEYFFAHQEEIDLCWRMQLMGYKIYVQPASVVYHVGGGTLPRGNSKKTYLNYRNNLIMLYKNTAWQSIVWKMPLRLLLDVVAAYKGLFSGDAGYFFAIAKAHIHFVQWLLFYKKKSLFVLPINKILTGKYNGSILWNFYLRKRKTFSEIINVT